MFKNTNDNNFMYLVEKVDEISIYGISSLQYGFDCIKFYTPHDNNKVYDTPESLLESYGIIPITPFSTKGCVVNGRYILSVEEYFREHNLYNVLLVGVIYKYIPLYITSNLEDANSFINEHKSEYYNCFTYRTSQIPTSYNSCSCNKLIS